MGIPRRLRAKDNGGMLGRRAEHRGQPLFSAKVTDVLVAPGRIVFEFSSDACQYIGRADWRASHHSCPCRSHISNDRVVSLRKPELDARI
jgi:hypothetical protein